MSSPIDAIIVPVAVVDRAIYPGVGAVALLLTRIIEADVLRAFWPFFSTLSALSVIFPESFISCSLLIGVYTVPFALVVQPLPFIDISISMVESTIAASEAFLPLAVISSLIWPDH